MSYHNQKLFRVFLIVLVFVVLFAETVAHAQTTAFTYQGRLTDGGNPANGNYDLQFAVFDSLSGGAQVGSTQTLNTVAVSNGIFTVSLDFGASAFNGANRFLAISARLSGGGAFTLLSPRQQITSTPYAVRSLNAASADSVPVTGVPAGSGNYIQNSASAQAQASSNFNISGNGMVGGTLSGNVVNATTQYNLNGSRILSSAGAGNLFVGAGAGGANAGFNNSFFGSAAGQSNTSGADDSFFGSSAGFSNTTGFQNSFFGSNAGGANTMGASNSFFGSLAGRSNMAGNDNSFFGDQAGFSNRTGAENSFFGQRAGTSNTASFNSFFGAQAGQSNTTGDENSFFGQRAGFSNTTGAVNSFFGVQAGHSNTTGFQNSFLGNGAGGNNTTGNANSFFGFGAGALNTTGQGNTAIGFLADVRDNLTNATAIGFRAQVTTNNALVLGSINGINNATADTNVGIGTTAPLSKLHVSGTAIVRLRVNSDSNAGLGLTLNNQPKWSVATTGPGDFQIFNDALGNNALFIDSGTNIITAPPPVVIGSATTPISTQLTVDTSGSRALFVKAGTGGGRVAEFGANGDFQIDNSTTVGGRLTVKEDSTVLINNPPPGTATDPSLRLIVNGVIKAGYPAGAFPVGLCHDTLQRIVECVSSIRYKKNVNNLSSGFNLIRRLRPVSFNWKEGGEPDMGLIAEEVADAEPLLVTHNSKGEILGVKYDRVGVVLINAVKEQQEQIQQQQNEIASLRTMNAALNERLRLIEKRLRNRSKPPRVRH